MVCTITLEIEQVKDLNWIGGVLAVVSVYEYDLLLTRYAICTIQVRLNVKEHSRLAHCWKRLGISLLLFFYFIKVHLFCIKLGQ